MKPYKYLFLPLLILPLATSCDKEEPLDGPVSLNPNVAGVSLTRGGINDVAGLTAIGIYAVNNEEDKNADDSHKNTYGTWPAGTYGKYTKDSQGSFKPDAQPTDQTIWLNLDRATIFACHPAADVTPGQNADGTKAVPTIQVPTNCIDFEHASLTGTDNDFADPNNDYMYGVEYCSSTFQQNQPIATNGRAAGSPSPNVNIGFKHAFTQIKLVISKHKDYQGNCNVSKVIYTRNMPTLGASTKMQLTDGKLIDLGAASSKTYSYIYGTSTAITGENTLTFTNYAIPYYDTLTENLQTSTITVTVDGKEMTIENKNEVAWEAGNIYTYTISIHPTGLQFSGINIVGWNNITDIPNTDI